MARTSNTSHLVRATCSRQRPISISIKIQKTIWYARCYNPTFDALNLVWWTIYDLCIWCILCCSCSCVRSSFIEKKKETNCYFALAKKKILCRHRQPYALQYKICIFFLSSEFVFFNFMISAKNKNSFWNIHDKKTRTHRFLFSLKKSNFLFQRIQYNFMSSGILRSKFANIIILVSSKSLSMRMNRIFYFHSFTRSIAERQPQNLSSLSLFICVLIRVWKIQ